MFLTEDGKLIGMDMYGIENVILGCHWKYCSTNRKRRLKWHQKLYSYDGMSWYSLMDEEPVDVSNEKINARPCSKWEWFSTLEQYTDLRFTKTFKNSISVVELMRSGMNIDKLLEGLLS